ncbi:MAG: cyclohydrolase 1 type 2 [Candidatus Hydrogenedentes bacterium]|nr:cyclohydrolase 1 type 2 [Candidatus Hydrogenedentota bacterium]
MIVRDVCDVVERLAPLGFAYEWDRSGLNIGDPGAEVDCVLVALTVTRPVLDAACKAGAQMIVSHHPVLWEPLKTLRTDDPATRLCLDLAQAGIACYAAHTNLDVTPGGVNDILADRLGLRNRAPLFPMPRDGQVKLVTFVPESHLDAVRDAVCAAGAGVIGPYTHCTFSAPGTGTFHPSEAANPYSGEKNRINEEPERRFETLVTAARLPWVLDALRAAHPYESVAYDVVCLDNRDPAIGLGVRGELEQPVALDVFARQACAALEVSHVRVSGDPGRMVQRVAALGGAGGGEAARVPAGIDVYLTGDIEYHDARAAEERGLAVVDAGHAGTEKWIVPELARYIEHALPSLRVETFAEPETFRVVTE